MFAECMTIIVPGNDRTEVIKVANDELNSIYSCLESYTLTVNTHKTKYMILSVKPRG